MADVSAARNEQGHRVPERSDAETGWARERNVPLRAREVNSTRSAGRVGRLSDGNRSS